MTTWVEKPEGGRERGPRAIARAWIEVLVRPGRFFRAGVGPGDQAPGLTFAVVVAVAYAIGWIVVEPASVPVVTESWLLSAVVTVLVVGVLAAPVGLHVTAAVAVVSLVCASLRHRTHRWLPAALLLVVIAAIGLLAVQQHLAALATAIAGVGLLAVARRGFGFHERAGVSETVQVVAYASAPMAIAGPPIPELRIACGVYAAVLLAIGLRTVHGVSYPRAVVAAIVPALIGYGVGYRAIEAGRTLLAGAP